MLLLLQVVPGTQKISKYQILESFFTINHHGAEISVI